MLPQILFYNEKGYVAKKKREHLFLVPEEKFLSSGAKNKCSRTYSLDLTTINNFLWKTFFYHGMLLIKHKLVHGKN